MASFYTGVNISVQAMKLTTKQKRYHYREVNRINIQDVQETSNLFNMPNCSGVAKKSRPQGMAPF